MCIYLYLRIGSSTAPQSLKLTLTLETATFISFNHNEIGVKLTQESLLENILANPAPTIPF